MVLFLDYCLFAGCLSSSRGRCAVPMQTSLAAISSAPQRTSSSEPQKAGGCSSQRTQQLIPTATSLPSLPPLDAFVQYSTAVLGVQHELCSCFCSAHHPRRPPPMSPGPCPQQLRDNCGDAPNQRCISWWLFPSLALRNSMYPSPTPAKQQGKKRNRSVAICAMGPAGLNTD